MWKSIKNLFGKTFYAATEAPKFEVSSTEESMLEPKKAKTFSKKTFTKPEAPAKQNDAKSVIKRLKK